jgi:hypothetical protein
MGEIWITGKRTLTGELRQADRQVIGTTGSGVVKANQLRFSDGPFAVGRRFGVVRGSAHWGDLKEKEGSERRNGEK